MSTQPHKFIFMTICSLNQKHCYIHTHTHTEHVVPVWQQEHILSLRGLHDGLPTGLLLGASAGHLPSKKHRFHSCSEAPRRVFGHTSPWQEPPPGKWGQRHDECTNIKHSNRTVNHKPLVITISHPSLLYNVTIDNQIWGSLSGNHPEMIRQENRNSCSTSLWSFWTHGC